MHKFIKIDEVYIKFNYQFDDYFSNSIDKYVTNDQVDDFINMSVKIKRDLDFNSLIPLSYKTKNQLIYETNNEKYIVTYIEDFSEVKHIIYYTLDYKTIEIYLNDKIGKRLAEFEYVLTGMMFLELAVYNKYLPIHASAFSVGSYTILLSAPSGIGKSTQTRFMKEMFDNVSIINEDKPLLKIIGNECYVLGSIWSGKDVINDNVKRKVDAIFFINQSDKLDIVNLDNSSKIKHIFKNIQRPVYQDIVSDLSSLIDDLINKCPIYMFNCINDVSSAKYLYDFLEGLDENKI